MDFKYGELIVKCHQCGDVQILEEYVTDGRAIYLFNKDDSYLRLHCPKCDITMEMCLQPSKIEDAEIIEETSKEIKEDEKLQEEITTAEVI